MLRKYGICVLFAAFCFSFLSAFAENNDYLPITDIFPAQKECHTHGSTLVYACNSLIAAWFHGNGERTADEVQIKGSILQFSGNPNWSEPFQIAYSGTGYPDINPCLLITKDPITKNKIISAYWMKIFYHEWEGAQVHTRNGILIKETTANKKTKKADRKTILKSIDWQDSPEGRIVNINYPDNFSKQIWDELSNTWPLKNGKFKPGNLTEQQKIDMYIQLCDFLGIKPNVEKFKKTTGIINTTLSGLFDVFTVYVVARLELQILNPQSKYYNLGWETRCNPLKIRLPNGSFRLLLPLYADGLNISMVAYSDDNGFTWTASPIASRSGIQPSLVQTEEIGKLGNKRILAFMRNNGGIINLGMSLLSYSDDNGETWSPSVPNPEFTNSSTSLNVCKLNYDNHKDGITYKNAIALVCNPDNDRKILELGISTDNGKTWSKKILEKAEKDTPTKFEYPSIVQVPGGELYISFTHTGVQNVSGTQTIGIVHINPKDVIQTNQVKKI